MSRPCANGSHRAVATPFCVFLTLPTDNGYGADRWSAYYCLRHGRQLLMQFYKSGIDTQTELGEPEFCLGCGEPAHELPLVASVYEGEWYARFELVMCEHCGLSAPSSLGEGLSSAQKLPKREASTSGRGRKNHRL